ncbi:MAG TPA: ATP-grasp domain-containing protein [Bacteroidales bacterium]|nr:ATP-grasp domain-containing protein [Bacteroidales bacterium]
MKKCCIIYNEPGETATADELDVLDQVEHIAAHLAEMDINVSSRGITVNFMKEIEDLAKKKYDFVFNLVESINNKGELNYFIPALLNMYSIPYSGCPLEAIFTTSSKTLAGRMMRDAGIRNPSAFRPSQMALLEKGRKYILKPVWEDGSLGITDDSVFELEQGESERLSGLDDAHWFVEDYIDGREFNISVLAGPNGPEVLPPAEIVFMNYGENRPRIVDFKAKWDADSFEYTNTVRQFPGNTISKKLESGLINAATGCWHLFGLKGYARVDMRTDKDENVFVIEVNANPCISPDSGFVAAVREAGYLFTSALERIINDLNI